MISNFELLEIRHVILNLIKRLTKVNYFHVILNDTRQLIDFFVDERISDVMQFKGIKEVINKFEHLK